MEDVGVGGLIRCRNGRAERSNLEIRADGRIQIERLGDCGAVFESRLSKDELQALLHEIVDGQQFLELTTPGIEDEIRAKRGPGPYLGRMGHAGDTVVRVRTADRDSEVTYNAPAVFAREYPGAKQIARFAEVVARLKTVANQVADTGKQTAALAALKANNYLATARPDLPRVETVDHVRSFTSDSGRWSSEFRHDRGDGTILIVTVVDAQNEKPLIVVETRPAR
jgi:hypothetical protein